MAGYIPVADQHRHVRGQALGAQGRRAEACGHGEENYRPALLGGQDRPSLAAWHVYAHDRDVGWSPGGFHLLRESDRVSGVRYHYLVGKRGLWRRGRSRAARPTLPIYS